MDYYGYAPLATLPRPLALCGLPGSDVGKTARAINLITGIPFVWIDRQVEHKLGRSVELVSLEQGLDPRFAAEREVLDEVLQARTPPLVALTDVTLTAPALRTLVADQMDVVQLHLTIDEAATRVVQQAAKDARAHYALRQAQRVEPAVIRPRLDRLAEPLKGLGRVVRVQGRSPLEVARQIAQELGAMAS